MDDISLKYLLNWIYSLIAFLIELKSELKLKISLNWNPDKMSSSNKVSSSLNFSSFLTNFLKIYLAVGSVRSLKSSLVI